MRILFTVLFLLTTSASSAQSYTYLNQKPPYSNGLGSPWVGDWLTATNLPRIGTTFQVSVPGGFTTRPTGGGPISGTTWLATGVSNPDIPFRAFSGYLYSSAELLTQVPTDLFPHMVTVSFAIPNSPILIGVSFYQQVVVHFAGAPSPGPLSRGGHGVIGR